MHIPLDVDHPAVRAACEAIDGEDVTWMAVRDSLQAALPHLLADLVAAWRRLDASLAEDSDDARPAAVRAWREIGTLLGEMDVDADAADRLGDQED